MSSDALGSFPNLMRTTLTRHHSPQHSQKAATEVYQTSTMAALLDGICHHLRSDGSASVASSRDRTPFAAVTWFKPETTIDVPGPVSRGDITGLIDQAIKITNLIQAVWVDGTFRHVKTRMVEEQKPPYPPRTQATANEPITEFHRLAGYRTPDYEQGISVAGYHLHFMNQPRTHGGHSLDFALERGEIAISTSSELHLSLPRTEAFLTAQMSLTEVAQQHRTEGV
jgi:acetolactate decarboxylase